MIAPKIIARPGIARPGGFQVAPKVGCRVVPAEGRLAMKIDLPDIPTILQPAAELDRLGDEIAELSAHLEAATARLLDLIRDFDARGGWNTGFRSCAAWLSWRVGLDLGAAREKVRVARALGTLPLLAQALARGETLVRQGPGPDPGGHAGDRRAAAGGGHGRARPPTSSGSCAAGGEWTGRPRPGRPRGSTRAGRFTCTRTRTAWWCSEDG